MSGRAVKPLKPQKLQTPHVAHGVHVVKPQKPHMPIGMWRLWPMHCAPCGWAHKKFARDRPPDDKRFYREI
jgi:hypothetical protein